MRNLKYYHVVSMAKKVSASSQNMLLHVNQIKRLCNFSKILLAMKVKTILSVSYHQRVHVCVYMCVVLRQTLANVHQ